MTSRRSSTYPFGLALALVLGVVVVLSSPNVSAGTVRPDAAPPREDRNAIHLKSRTFTPAPGLQRAAIVGNRAAAEPVHFIAQFAPVPSSEDRTAFAKAGVRLLSPLGGGAYVARSTGAKLAGIKALPGFRWAGPLQAADKIDPGLRGGKVPAHARAQDGRVALTVQVHGDLAVRDAARIAREHGGQVIGRVPLIPSVTALFEADRVPFLAAEDAVLYVAALDAPLQEHNDGAVAALNAAPVYAAPYNLDGTGTTVLVYDSGIANHSDYNARITQTDGDVNVPTRSHSTHVAGTVLGNGANSTGTDSAGTANNGSANQWAGLATAANLATFGSQGSNPSSDVLYDDAGDINADFTTAITGGIDLATMSLGNNTGSNGFPCTQLGDYTNTSILIDQIVFGSINGQELTWFESAGNERNDGCAPTNGFSTISSPAPAKNSIVVGATNSNDNSMTNFSSWGPTDDGRIRPDLVGPGCQSTGDANIWSTDFVDDGDGNLEAGEALNSYSGKCGTSMATPAVAGVGALLTQQWEALNGAGTRPLPHTMKAVLAHTATDLGNAGPDYSNGYGHVNAQAAVDVVRANNLIKVDQVDQGDIDTWYFSSDGTAAPRITVAWSDPAAARNSATQLVNDVDLVVTQPGGTVRRPQILDPANPGNNAVEGDDNLNVMEMVLGSAEAGNWKVEVRGATIAQGPSVYTLVTPNPATDNAPPVADAGGPYNTVEGAPANLDGTGSTDPEGGTLTYEWDLDNDGIFETSGEKPTFPAQGQDGVYTVVLKVTDPGGSSSTDTATVTVANVAPTVSILPIATIDERGTTTVSGTVTDPGWLDTLTATVSFDDGTATVPLPLTFVENTPPDVTYTFSVNRQYGDNGSFDVTVTGFDDDSSGADTEAAVVNNLDPTAAVGLSGQQVYDGKSAFVAEAGETISVPATSTDEGSDDLRFTWSWGDGTSTVQHSLVDPPVLDPAKSPTVEPRDVTLSADHAYGEACLYNLDVGLRDDDAGTGSAAAVVLVTGNARESKGHGWWLNQYRPKGDTFTPERLQCYLDIANYFSKVFSEHKNAATRAQAAHVLNAPAKAPEDVIFDQHALGAWLNFANGSVKLGTLVDTDGDGVRDTAFGTVMLTAENVRVDPTSTLAEVKAQKDILDRIIAQAAP